MGHGSGEEEAIFPLPFILVFAGYIFILTVDRVMFDSHSLFDDGHGHHHDNGMDNGHDESVDEESKSKEKKDHNA